MKDIVWRVMVSKIEEVHLVHVVTGALKNENARTQDASVVMQWKFVGSPTKSTDSLLFLREATKEYELPAEDFGIPKYVQASIVGLARTMIAADKKKVLLPIDFFDPSGPRGRRTEAHCSPESE